MKDCWCLSGTEDGMVAGRSYLVACLYLDPGFPRIAASAKLEKFLDNVIPEYQVEGGVSH